VRRTALDLFLGFDRLQQFAAGFATLIDVGFTVPAIVIGENGLAFCPFFGFVIELVIIADVRFRIDILADLTGFVLLLVHLMQRGAQWDQSSAFVALGRARGQSIRRPLDHRDPVAIIVIVETHLENLLFIRQPFAVA